VDSREARAQTHTQVKPFFGYIRLLLEALLVLPQEPKV
jgi:hypothetical protein